MPGFRYLTDAETGPNLRRLRRRARMTQAALAVASGRAQSFISAIERGRAHMTSSDIVHFAEALGIRSQQLVSLDPDWDRFVRSARTPAEKEALQIFSDLIDDYLGLEALVGNPDRLPWSRRRPATPAT